MKKNKLVFVIQAYSNEMENKQLNDVVILELIDSSYKKALVRAKSLVKKPKYRLSRIIEK